MLEDEPPEAAGCEETPLEAAGLDDDVWDADEFCELLDGNSALELDCPASIPGPALAEDAVKTADAPLAFELLLFEERSVPNSLSIQLFSESLALALELSSEMLVESLFSVLSPVS